jgi:alkylhydroperoxidase family enzyme
LRQSTQVARPSAWTLQAVIDAIVYVGLAGGAVDGLHPPFGGVRVIIVVRVRLAVPLIDYVPYGEAASEVREALADSAYAESEDRHLFYELLSNADVVLPARAAYFKTMMREGAVPLREKELAYFTVAVLTDTRFVAATHGRYLVEDHGFDPEGVAALAAGDRSGLPAREEAVVEFARTATRRPADVDEAMLDALRETGYEDGQIVELLLLIGDARTATTIVTAMGIELADRGETEPEFLPETFGL